MLLCKKIKIEVSEQDAATLEFMQGKCRGLYNWWVMKLRDGEKWSVNACKKTLAESRLHDPELGDVYGKLLAEVYFRNMVARLTETPPASFKEVAISRDGRGDYYASFPYQVDEQPVQTGTVVAFDLGIKMLATGVNEQGRVYHVGGLKGGKWYNKQLDKIRSKRDKCKKKSRRYIYLSKVYKRVSQKKRNKQKDCLHKASHLVSHKLVERTVVVGDLSQRQMVMKEHQERNKALNRAVYNDWSLYTFLQKLTYKCQLSGKEVVMVDENNTSKACSGCGALQSMPLYKRTYGCGNCGLVMDRDENSAVNILNRFLARRGPHTPVECGVLQDAGIDGAGMELAQPCEVQQRRV